jgi:cobalt-zinc-cadmium efflux system protein
MSRDRRLAVALGVNLAVVVVQVVAGFAARSLGLLADAGHNLTDVVAVLVSLVAVRLSTRRPTSSRSFGYHRSTVLAAQANAALVIGVTAVIGFEGVRRLIHPAPVHGVWVLGVAAVAVVANLLAALAVHDHSHDLNMRAALLHLMSDAAASAGVAVAGGVMLATGSATWLDPAVSLAVGALILVEATQLLREATDVLLESTPAGLDVDAVAATIAAVPGVDEVHDIHAWSLSSEVRALSAHLVMSGHPTLEEAQAVAERAKQAVANRFAIAHTTLELECESCVEPGSEPCAMDDLVPGAQPMDGH